MTFNGGIGGTGNVTLQVNDAQANSTLTIGTNGINNTGTITNNGAGTANQKVTISGVIGTNVQGVIQNSGKTILVLSGANTYTADTTVTAGTLNLSEASGASSTAAQDSVINLNGGALTFGTSTTSATIGGLSGSGNLNLANTATTPGAVNLIIGNSNTSTGFDTLNPTYSGAISNTAGAASLTKVGTNTQTLSGTNTYTGGTTINGGTLAISALANINGTNSTTLTFGGGTLEVTSAGFDLGNLGANTIKINSGGGTIQVDSGTLTESSAIQPGTGSVGGLTKTGTGTLIFTAANTYTGTTNINAGVIQYNNSTAFGANSAIVVASGATALFEEGINDTGTNSITISGAGAASAHGALDFAGTTNSPTGATFVMLRSSWLRMRPFPRIRPGDGYTLDGGITGSGHTLTVVGPGFTEINSVINTGSGGLNVNGSAGLYLEDANTYTGGTAINSGFLELDNALAAQDSVVSVNTTNGLQFYNATAGSSYTIGGLSGASNLALVDNSATGLVNLVVGNANGNNTYSGVLSDGGGRHPR